MGLGGGGAEQGWKIKIDWFCHEGFGAEFGLGVEGLGFGVEP